jgi:hypothetical protein
MLMAERSQKVTVYITDEAIRALEELQNVASEGPCIDAYTLGRPVLEPDLANNGTGLWPLLAPGALDAGMGALFSFPLAAGRHLPRGPQPLPGWARLPIRRRGRRRPTARRHGLPARPRHASHAPGSLPAQMGDLSGDRVGIEQATGMVAAQVGIPIADAAERLRQTAADQHRHLADVARDIVTRQLRMHREPED